MTLPSIPWRPAIQMLMGTDFIVPEPELSKSELQAAEVGCFQLIEFFLQGTKKRSALLFCQG